MSAQGNSGEIAAAASSAAGEGAEACEPLGAVLAEQARYYRDRAGEYEDWWYRRGRYDRGEAANATWFADVDQLRMDVSAEIASDDRVLELACGTGLWTVLLAEHAASVTALDASAEVIAIARTKVAADRVSFLQANLFEWQPNERYDLCFFAFWLSHVPLQLMAPFWAKVADALAPGGRVYVIDSATSERASASDHQLQPRGHELMTRRLDDGREYRIVKHWFDAPALSELLRRLGWEASIASTSEFFVHGHVRPP